jgi:exodeoxyribonuclease VII large subunit
LKRTSSLTLTACILSLAPITLSQLTGLIHKTLDDQFSGKSFWVIAELSNLSHYASSHSFYFHLVEKDKTTGKIKAEVSSVAFGNASYEIEAFEKQTGQRFQNGIELLVNLSVTYHPIHGLKLNLLKIDPSFTIGQLQKQRDATLARLVHENPDAVYFSNGQYITRNQQLNLPFVFSRIAIISSENSAGFQDFEHTLNSNEFGYVFRLQLFKTAVQGEDKGQQLVDRLIQIYKDPEPFDLVVFVRGGGAQTDFLLYDSYNVARAIARFPIPILTGLGHLKDVSVCDMMAHTALKTPTKAAEFILARNKAFEDAVLNLRQQIIIRSQQTLMHEKEMLSNIRSHMQRDCTLSLSSSSEKLQIVQQYIFNQSNFMLAKHNQSLNKASRTLTSIPSIIAASARNNLETIKDQINAAPIRFLKEQQASINHFKTVFKLLSPAQTLKRGFAIIMKGDNIITDPSKISKGDTVTVHLSGTELETKIIQKHAESSKRFDV